MAQNEGFIRLIYNIKKEYINKISHSAWNIKILLNTNTLIIANECYSEYTIKPYKPQSTNIHSKNMSHYNVP